MKASLYEKLPRLREILVDHTGSVWHVHGRATCKGRCALHRPTEHGMRSLPVIIRETGLIERICEHGVGHPDPDSLAWFNKTGQKGYGVHGCCGNGCCRSKRSVHERR